MPNQYNSTIGDKIVFTKRWQSSQSQHTGEIYDITPSGQLKLKSDIGKFKIINNKLFTDPKTKPNLFTPYYTIVGLIRKKSSVDDQ